MNNNFTIQRPDHISELRKIVDRDALQLLSSVKLQPGQSLWKLNLATHQIDIVNYDVTAINLDGSISSRIITEDNHLYCVAINLKNATRKFINMCNKIADDAKGTQAAR